MFFLFWLPPADSKPPIYFERFDRSFKSSFVRYCAILCSEDVAVRDTSTLSSIVRELNSKKVFLRVVRFFGERVMPRYLPGTNGSIRKNLRAPAAVPQEFSDDGIAAPPSPKAAAARSAKEIRSPDLLSTMVNADTLAVRLG